MRIDKKMIDKLDSQGIRVRIYPESNADDAYKRLYEFYYDDCRHYVTRYEWDSVQMKSVALPLTADGVKYLEELADQRARWTMSNYYDATKLYITYGGDKVIIKNIPAKSKEVSERDILAWIDKDKALYATEMGKFVEKMKHLLSHRASLDVYPTTYGVGIWNMCNWHVKENIAEVENLMKSRGIEYYNEYSDKGWVYRFKVSKKQQNLSKIA